MSGKCVALVVFTVFLGSGCGGTNGTVASGGSGGSNGSGGSGGGAGSDCANNFDCEEGEYCASTVCGGTGSCESKPLMCPDVVEPVCGCDEATYESECEAQRAGVRVASEGRCACAENADCAAPEYCDGERCDGAGSCAVRPEECTAVLYPVCGCDGNTYDNPCLAAAAGVRVESEGECPCESNDDCLEIEYCNGPTCDGPGVCVRRQEFCAPTGEAWCGCDGGTYDSQCLASVSGVRIDHEGPCP